MGAVKSLVNLPLVDVIIPAYIRKRKSIKIKIKLAQFTAFPLSKSPITSVVEIFCLIFFKMMNSYPTSFMHVHMEKKSKYTYLKNKDIFLFVIIHRKEAKHVRQTPLHLNSIVPFERYSSYMLFLISVTSSSFGKISNMSF